MLKYNVREREHAYFDVEKSHIVRATLSNCVLFLSHSFIRLPDTNAGKFCTSFVYNFFFYSLTPISYLLLFVLINTSNKIQLLQLVLVVFFSGGVESVLS